MISKTDRGDKAEHGSESEESEAFGVLCSLAGNRSGAIPGEILARLVMAVTEGADWVVRRAALDAALRRVASCHADDLRVASRPPGGEPFGAYATRRRGGRPRPHTTVLESADPLRGRCDCRDFVRSSLGLCKHLVAVYEDLARRPRKYERALRDGAARPRLFWHPIRALTGPGDWMDGIRLRVDAEGRSAAWKRLRGRFARDAEDGTRRLRETHADDARRRLSLVESLLAAARRPEPDPALRALLLREKEALRRTLGGGEACRGLGRSLRTLKRALYPYQRRGVERFLSRGTLLLGDDMGLGKTAQATAACHVLWTRGSVRRGLLIVPASLKPQWVREWLLFSDAPIEVVDGGPAQRAELYESTKSGFLVANYEQVLRDLSLMHAWRPDLVVLDEAQRIKNWATKTAAHVKRLRPAYRLVLTGTPMENRLDELASLMDWVDDMALEPKWRLAPWHTSFADGRRVAVGARNLETLRARLAPSLLRRVRSEVLDQLPPRTDTAIPVAMTEDQLDAHDALSQPIAALARAAERRPLTQAEFLKLMQLLTTQRVICNGLAQACFESVWPELEGRGPSPSRLKSLDSPKLGEFREVLHQLVVEQGRKVVVFSQWRRMLRLAAWAVGDLLGDHGLRAAFFTGKESQRRRTGNVVDFHDDPATRVLFATDAGGVGLNLQRAATCCINLEMPWNPAVLEQRIGRIHRLGQKRPIDVYNLIAEDGIEARVASAVGTKKELFDGLFDGTSDEIRFDGATSFLSRLEKIVKPVDVPDLAEDEAAAAERETEALVAAADESGDREPPAQAIVGPDQVAVRSLLGQVRVEPTDDGGLRLEAPPEAAQTLIGLLEGFADLLRASEVAGETEAAPPERVARA